MSIFTVTCPSCETEFPVDPAKVPQGGVRARCSVCGGIFPVERPRTTDADVGGVSEATVALSTADRLGDAAFPEAGPDPDERPEPWSGVRDEVDEAAPGAEFETTFPAVYEEVEEVDEVSESAEVAEIGEPVAFEPDALDVEADEELAPEVVADPLEASWAVEPPPAAEAPPVPEAPPASEAPPAEVPPQDAAPLPQSFQFGRRDPHDKAKRLARVLVSDIITYNPERYLKALENDTLAEDFDEEIRKSWNEYVEQVGSEMARETRYWTEALNDLLARGRDVF